MKSISKILLEKEAVRLKTDEPFTYVSGIRSPIYCDSRVLIYYPEERTTIVNAYVDKLKNMDFDVVAGVATGAISWGAWIADRLGKPFVYIRKKSKGYGEDKRVEGGDITGKKVIVIEDMVSTGGSAVNAVEAVRNEGGDVLALAVMFTYNLPKALKRFEEAQLDMVALTDFATLVQVAGEENLVEKDKLELVLEWRKDPQGWGPKNGFPLGEKKN